MIDTDFLSAPQLAGRWGQEPWQIIDHGLALRLPILFRFDGMAFDFNDRWHRDTGAHTEQQELAQKAEWVKGCEALIKRNAAGLTGEFDRLDSREVVELRGRINEAKERISQLNDLLDKREQERRKSTYNGLMRALPRTLQDIQQAGETAFPYLAMHPQSPVYLTESEGKQNLDGRIMSLEPGISGAWKQRLFLDDLLIPMQIIKTLEAKQKGEIENKPLPKARRQEQAVIAALRQLGYDPSALPPRKPGTEWVKAQTWRELESRKDLFTKGTFNSTWDHLRANGDIAEQA
ncbi:hypothetical protein [Pseudomonas sp. PS02303]|uniref:hypothetical protein n=1 Tax=Pseudomonas sp. PS02303 TaxID=2991429 RepID=UPI00249A16CA|nr:hypothetical protein [Pseudomonas sp. PS02303]